MSKKVNIPAWSGMPAAGIAGFANPLMNNPLASSLSGGFDFVKNMFGGLPSAIPGFVVPTVDIEELDKRITDLKAVESWLAMNANMLRATIQSLEVQRNTIATIKSFGGSFTGAAGEMAAQIDRAKPSGAEGSYANWPNPQHTLRPGPSAAVPGAPAHAKPASNPAPKAARRSTPPARTRPSKPEQAASGAALTPASWLGYLQDQFNQVAQAALSGSPVAESTKPASAATKGVKATTAKRRAAKRTGSKARP